jgi:hypothetical protein
MEFISCEETASGQLLTAYKTIETVHSYSQCQEFLVRWKVSLMLLIVVPTTSVAFQSLCSALYRWA